MYAQIPSDGITKIIDFLQAQVNFQDFFNLRPWVHTSQENKSKSGLCWKIEPPPPHVYTAGIAKNLRIVMLMKLVLMNGQENELF